MSWGMITTPATEQADLAAAIDTAVQTYRDNLAKNDYVLDDDANAQVTAAKAAALAVAQSGAVGTGKVIATLSGHANPGHQPTAGMANDCITVYVSNAEPQPVA